MALVRATDAMVAIITNRSDRGRPLTWIEIGSVAGRTAEIPSAALRAARLQLVGSGQGSVSTREYLAELDVLAQEITVGTISVDARAVPPRPGRRSLVRHRRQAPHRPRPVAVAVLIPLVYLVPEHRGTW